MRRQTIMAGGLFVVLVLATGCGGPVNVQGKVVKDGKPVAGATVMFIPVNGGQEAGDFTDDEGNFRLKNPQKFGLVPGEYLVTVSKMEYPPGMKVPTPQEMTMKMTAKMRESLPAQYTTQDKTPLRVTVPRGGITDVILDIK
jgi:hypothetical protein